MAKKKKIGKQDDGNRSIQSINIRLQLFKIITGLCLLVMLVIAVGILAHHILLNRPLSATILPSAIAPSLDNIYPEEEISLTGPKIPFEVPPSEQLHDDPPVPPETPPVEDTSEGLPKLCIIIDDMGYHKKLGEDLIKLDGLFTISILPHSPHRDHIAQLAHKYGHEVLLHQPMVPNEYPHFDPGKGAVFLDMLPDEIIEIVNENIESIPHAVGVNNHMGSRFTQSAAHMRQVLTVIKKRNLFFVDSVTTPQSMVAQSAQLIKVPFAKRDVFIDHDQDVILIKKQLELLVKKAIKNRKAIGIAHPHKETYEMMKELLPMIKQHTEIVPVSRLVQ